MFDGINEQTGGVRFIKYRMTSSFGFSVGFALVLWSVCQCQESVSLFPLSFSNCSKCSKHSKHSKHSKEKGWGDLDANQTMKDLSFRPSPLSRIETSGHFLEFHYLKEDW